LRGSSAKLYFQETGYVKALHANFSLRPQFGFKKQSLMTRMVLA